MAVPTRESWTNRRRAVVVGGDVQPVEDLDDLTSQVASAQQRTGRSRSGIFLCSSVYSEAEDLRSVYRFLNTSFLTELRRGDGIGVCAVVPSAAVGTDLNSVVAGMNASFKT